MYTPAEFLQDHLVTLSESDDMVGYRIGKLWALYCECVTKYPNFFKVDRISRDGFTSDNMYNLVLLAEVDTKAAYLLAFIYDNYTILDFLKEGDPIVRKKNYGYFIDKVRNNCPSKMSMGNFLHLRWCVLEVVYSIGCKYKRVFYMSRDIYNIASKIDMNMVRMEEIIYPLPVTLILCPFSLPVFLKDGEEVQCSYICIRFCNINDDETTYYTEDTNNWSHINIYSGLTSPNCYSMSNSIILSRSDTLYDYKLPILRSTREFFGHILSYLCLINTGYTVEKKVVMGRRSGGNISLSQVPVVSHTYLSSSVSSRSNSVGISSGRMVRPHYRRAHKRTISTYIDECGELVKCRVPVTWSIIHKDVLDRLLQDK